MYPIFLHHREIPVANGVFPVRIGFHTEKHVVQSEFLRRFPIPFASFPFPQFFSDFVTSVCGLYDDGSDLVQRHSFGCSAGYRLLAYRVRVYYEIFAVSIRA